MLSEKTKPDKSSRTLLELEIGKFTKALLGAKIALIEYGLLRLFVLKSIYAIDIETDCKL